MKKGILFTIIGVLSVAVVVLAVLLVKSNNDNKRRENDVICEGGETTSGSAEVETTTQDMCNGYTTPGVGGNTIEPRKPVIYLYPEKETMVSVKLDFNGELTYTYPTYKNGWKITAKPDGTLIDDTGREYYCLFWEGKQNVEYDMSKGFVVAGSETAAFLEEKLEILGLTDKEANEFIIYWLPQMENNKYNLISFQEEVYTDNAKLKITPEPDSVLRVFMAWQPLEEKIEIEEQILESFDRKGFTVVEWGGAGITAR